MVQDARTPEHRALLLDMAQRWLELAEHTSRIQGLVDQGWWTLAWWTKATRRWNGSSPSPDRRLDGLSLCLANFRGDARPYPGTFVRYGRFGF